MLEKTNNDGRSKKLNCTDANFSQPPCSSNAAAAAIPIIARTPLLIVLAIPLFTTVLTAAALIGNIRAWPELGNFRSRPKDGIGDASDA